MILHIQGMIHSVLRGRKDCTSCTTSPLLIDSVEMFPRGNLWLQVKPAIMEQTKEKWKGEMIHRERKQKRIGR